MHTTASGPSGKALARKALARRLDGGPQHVARPSQAAHAPDAPGIALQAYGRPASVLVEVAIHVGASHTGRARGDGCAACQPDSLLSQEPQHPGSAASTIPSPSSSRQSPQS
jgi:hypothetical protein